MSDDHLKLDNGPRRPDFFIYGDPCKFGEQFWASLSDALEKGVTFAVIPYHPSLPDKAGASTL